MKVVIITGMSGAGKSRAIGWFEDKGYYCVDNMPPALIHNFIDLAKAPGSGIDKIALVTDIRGKKFFSSLSTVIDELGADSDVELEVIFVDASNRVLARRYNETRRNHPVSGGKATLEVIEEEREHLKELQSKANIIIDTSNMKTADLLNELNEKMLNGDKSSTFSVHITSFGFKYGIPAESDMVADMRFLRNPYYVPSLRYLTGNNKKIVKYVMDDPFADKFLGEYSDIIRGVIPGFIEEGKYNLNIAVGCTGGHHRSVVMANALAEIISKDESLMVDVSHRDLDLMVKGK